MITAARTSDLSLPEFAAFNHGRNHSRMRRWELPFALFQARLSDTMAILDCTINPENLHEPLLSLYPHTLYHHWNPIQAGKFQLPLGVPDQAFDRVLCINTLEHLLEAQRSALLADLAVRLKPGGLLIITCDYYFEDFWQRPELLEMGVVRLDRQELFEGWNRVQPSELLRLCEQNNLHPMGQIEPEPAQNDVSLYRNLEPIPHATIGAVFYKGPGPILPDPNRENN